MAFDPEAVREFERGATPMPLHDWMPSGREPRAWRR